MSTVSSQQKSRTFSRLQSENVVKPTWKQASLSQRLVEGLSLADCCFRDPLLNLSASSVRYISAMFVMCKSKRRMCASTACCSSPPKVSLNEIYPVIHLLTEAFSRKARTHGPEVVTRPHHRSPRSSTIDDTEKAQSYAAGQGPSPTSANESRFLSRADSMESTSVVDYAEAESTMGITRKVALSKCYTVETH